MTESQAQDFYTVIGLDRDELSTLPDAAVTIVVQNKVRDLILSVVLVSPEELTENHNWENLLFEIESVLTDPEKRASYNNYLDAKAAATLVNVYSHSRDSEGLFDAIAQRVSHEARGVADHAHNVISGVFGIGS